MAQFQITKNIKDEYLVWEDEWIIYTTKSKKDAELELKSYKLARYGIK